MLLPIITQWIQDPWTNLFTQQVLSAGFGVFGLLALGYLLGQSLEASLVAGLLSLGLFVLLMLLLGDHTCLLEIKWKTGDPGKRLEWGMLLLAMAYLFHLVFWVNLSIAPVAIILVLLGWSRFGVRNSLLVPFLVLVGVGNAVLVDR